MRFNSFLTRHACSSFLPTQAHPLSYEVPSNDWGLRELEARASCLDDLDEGEIQAAVEELAEGLSKATGDEFMIYEGKRGAGNYSIYDLGAIQAWTFQSGDVRLKV
eukprot:1038147-Prorocentrum_minimum.AAC.1